MTGYFSVKGFNKFQHYKDRRPPWIKLYNDLLDDYEFGLLPDASKMHLVAIWLLASRYNNRIPHDAEWISRRISATENVNLEILEQVSFIIPEQDCSVLLSKCAEKSPETETETETEIEETNATALSKNYEKLELPEFMKATNRPKGNGDGRRQGTRCPTDLKVTDRDRGYAQSCGHTDEQIDSEWQSYVAHFTTGQGRNKTSANWHGGNSSWGTWCRNWKKWAAERMANRPSDNGSVAAVRDLMAQGESGG